MTFDDWLGVVAIMAYVSCAGIFFEVLWRR
jgi:hypothetical protein